MSKPLSTVDTRQLKKDAQKLIKATNQIAERVVATTIEQSQTFNFSFDETEVVPFVENADGKIVIATSDPKVDIEQLLLDTTESALNLADALLTEKMKEILK